jgi:AcrR family transcriptional regulator
VPQVRPKTHDRILDAAKQALMEHGYAGLSTRRVAEQAGVPLSQIHYHFGSKQQLILDLLREENDRLLERQETLFEADIPLWKQWETACNYLDDDLESGYVRILAEMIAAGWTDPDIATAVRDQLRGWNHLLTEVAGRAAIEHGGLGPFSPAEISALTSTLFIGAEAEILLGMDEDELPIRRALRKVGDLLRSLEEVPAE